MKHYDENKVICLVSRVAKINSSTKVIKLSKNQIIGIHMWGKIDFLTNYCDYRVIYDNTAGIGIDISNEFGYNPKQVRKEIKERKMANKKK